MFQKLTVQKGRKGGIWSALDSLKRLTAFIPFLFGVSEAVFQVGQDIVNMLSADGKPDGVGADARFQLGLPAELGMGGGRWMNHQGFHIRTLASRENSSK